jgi:hypothetical protein
MSTPYSKRFLAFKGDQASHKAVVPAGKVWVVKDITFVDISPTGQDYFVCDVPDGIHVFAWSQPANTAWLQNHWSGMVVANPGEAISAYASSATGFVTVSGYELNAS